MGQDGVRWQAREGGHRSRAFLPLGEWLKECSGRGDHATISRVARRLHVSYGEAFRQIKSMDNVRIMLRPCEGQSIVYYIKSDA